MVQFRHLVLLVAIVMVRSTSLQAVNVLVDTGKSDIYLQARQYLNVSTGFYLVMQPDCNLILYNRSLPIRSSNTSCTKRFTDLQFRLLAMTDTLLTYISGNVRDEDFDFYNLSSYILGVDSIPLYPYMLLRDSGRCDFYDLKGNRLNGTLWDSEAFPDATEFLYRYEGPVPRLAPNASDLSSVPNIVYPFPPELAWRPQKSLDGFPYLPAGYFLSQGSKLQTVDHRFALMLGRDCRMQSKATPENGTEQVLWETTTGSYNSSQVTRGGCELTLQQDGRLVIRSTNVSGVVYWNSSSAAGNDAVTWILRLNSSDGSLSIRDIENSSRVLWSNAILLNQTIPVPVQTNNRTVTWIVVGVSVGVFIVTVAALALFYLCVWTNILDDPAEKAFRQRLEEAGRKSQTRFSGTTLKQATNNFGDSIGSGGFGDVFYGKLPDGQEIAAKVLSAESHQSKHEFYNEIELLSVVHHRYLVSLLGYRCTRKQQILVYEYMSGGDLRQKLQGESAALNSLTWSQRTSIALQVAEGLEYLHDKCSPSIIHRDVKSTNILLTEKMVAKVADFGLSKLRKKDQEDATHVTTVVKGTPGYLDPEYHETGMLTDKSDVYAFGIVLMEILTGQNQMYIAHRVAEAWKVELGVYGLPDPNLKEKYDRDQFVSMIELALWCVRKRSGDRPLMRQVVQRLREMGLTPLEPSSDLGDSENGPRIMLPSLGIDIPEKSEPEYGHSCMLALSDSSSNGMNSETLQSGFQFRKSGR